PSFDQLCDHERVGTFKQPVDPAAVGQPLDRRLVELRPVLRPIGARDMYVVAAASRCAGHVNDHLVAGPHLQLSLDTAGEKPVSAWLEQTETNGLTAANVCRPGLRGCYRAEVDG